MRILLILLCLSWAGRLLAQAPITGLWEVPATTLAQPPALVAGPSGRYWNPASPSRGSLSAEVQVFESPEVLGVSGILAAVSTSLGVARLGVVLGRMDVDDLVRTSTSPIADQGDIPIFDQHLGVGIAAGGETASAGAVLRAHDSKFDTESETGLTLDVGFRIRPVAAVTLAGATHLLPADFSSQSNTEYLGGVEFLIFDSRLWGTGSRIVTRLGTAYRTDLGFNHQLGGGLVLGETLFVDGLLTREGRFDRVSWRSVLSLGLHVGRYLVSVSRGGGLNGVGATFKLGLEVEAIR